eukprot:1284606-Pyramimonas_sp.AAC.1
MLHCQDGLRVARQVLHEAHLPTTDLSPPGISTCQASSLLPRVIGKESGKADGRSVRVNTLCG